MTRDLGVWTAPDCALVLIDYQEEMFEVLRSIPAELNGIEPGTTCCASPMLPLGARRPHTAQASNGSPCQLMEDTKWPAG
jgi:hypothetical protein